MRATSFETQPVGPPAIKDERNRPHGDAVGPEPPLRALGSQAVDGGQGLGQGLDDGLGIREGIHQTGMVA